MSVTGEFQRVLGSFVAFLEECDTRGAEDCAAELRSCLEAGRGGGGGHALEQAAREVMARCGPAGALSRLELPRAGQRQRLREEREHLLALCRSIAGPPRDPAG